MSNERKYLKDGRVVELVQALENGKFLVQPLYFVEGCEGEDEAGFVDDTAPIIVNKVFDIAPSELYDADIMKAQEQLAQLRREIAAVESDRRAADQAHAARLSRLKKFDALKELETLIDSGYTHIVDFEGNSMGRITEATPDRDREFPMLTLWGKMTWNGEARWIAESGRRGALIPCTSLWQAKGIVRAKVEEALRHGDMNRANPDVVKLADEMNIPVPVAYRKRVLEDMLGCMNDKWVASQAQRANEELAKHNQRKADLLAQLDSLTKPKPAAPAPITDDGLDPF